MKCFEDTKSKISKAKHQEQLLKMIICPECNNNISQFDYYSDDGDLYCFCSKCGHRWVTEEE